MRHFRSNGENNSTSKQQQHFEATTALRSNNSTSKQQQYFEATTVLRRNNSTSKQQQHFEATTVLRSNNSTSKQQQHFEATIAALRSNNSTSKQQQHYFEATTPKRCCFEHNSNVVASKSCCYFKLLFLTQIYRHSKARSICTQRFASCHFSQHWNRYLLDCHPIWMTSCHSYARHTRRSKKFPRPSPVVILTTTGERSGYARLNASDE